MKFELSQSRAPFIKIFGIGDGGSKVVNLLYNQNIKNVDFVVCNYNQQALEKSPVPLKIFLEDTFTEKNSSRSLRKFSKNTSNQSIESLKLILSNKTEILFIIACLGGDSGTDGASRIAKTAKEMGILTVGIVTIPFSFENKNRQTKADTGLKELKQNVDSLIVISNDKLQKEFGNLSANESFILSNDYIATVVKYFLNFINTFSQINVVNDDLITIMKDSGDAFIAIGQSKDDNRALKAVKDVLNSPFLQNIRLEKAKYILLYITCGEDEITMDEIGQITDQIQNLSGFNTEIIIGMGIESELKNELKIALIGIGYQSHFKSKKNEIIETPEVVYFAKNKANEGYPTIPIPNEDKNDPFEEAKKRIERLSNLSLKHKANDQLSDLAREPAYKRKGSKLEASDVFTQSEKFPSSLYEKGDLKEGLTKLRVETSKEIRQLKEYLLLETKKTNDSIDCLNKEILNLSSENIRLKEIIYFDSTSYGSQVKIQTIPIEIYVDTSDSTIIYGVYDAVLEFLNSINFEKAFEFKAIEGSWFKKMVAKSKDVITSDAVIERLQKAEYGVEVNAILKQQSEIDKNQSEALLNILKSVEKVPNAAIRIGSLLVVKLTSIEGEVNVQVRSLSLKELHLLNKRPDLLHKPQQVLNALTKEINGDS